MINHDQTKKIRQAIEPISEASRKMNEDVRHINSRIYFKLVILSIWRVNVLNTNWFQHDKRINTKMKGTYWIIGAIHSTICCVPCDSATWNNIKELVLQLLKNKNNEEFKCTRVMSSNMYYNNEFKHVLQDDKRIAERK